MLRLASDADVNGHIIRGLLRRIPELDLLRSQDELPEGAPDPEVLEWAAADGRVLITNDRSTMTDHVRHRHSQGLSIPGVIFTSQSQAVGSAIEDIHVIAACMSEKEIEQRVVVHLPFRG